MALGGIDIGTSGCKCTVFSNDGTLISSSYREYNATRVHGAHEIDADAVWQAVKEIIAEAARKAGEKTNEALQAIGVTSFGESAVPIDVNGNILSAAMLYTDPRGTEQCKKICNRIESEKIARITGITPHQMFTLPKIMWIKENDPELFSKVDKFLLFEDFIVYMLTGNAVIDYSLATRTMAFDIRTFCWSADVMEAAGIPDTLFAKPVPTGSIAGTIKDEIALELDLPDNLNIVVCGHDQIGAAVGANVLKSGLAVDGTGTVACLTPVFDKIPENDILYKGNYAIVPHAVQGKYVTYAFTFTGGVLLKWFRDNFAKYEKDKASESGMNFYSYLDGMAGQEPTGILVLPHFAGAATPHMDDHSKGAIVGLTLETSQADVYKAIMEGVTYELLYNMEVLEAAGIKTGELRATGGGASSSVWLQMKADITARPIHSMTSKEAGANGSVMMAGVAVGIYGSLDAAAQVFVKEDKVYYPDMETHIKYIEIYQRYKKLYKAVKSVL